MSRKIRALKSSAGRLVGYARVSMAQQDLPSQVRALKAERAPRSVFLGAALDRIGAQHEQHVHHVSFKGCRDRRPRPIVLVEHVAHGLELADAAAAAN